MIPQRRSKTAPLRALTTVGAVALAFALAVAAPASGAGAKDGGPNAVEAVGAVGLTVADLDRSIRFYRDVLSFNVVGQTETLGPELEQLEGVFGAHVRSARLKLGAEEIVLTEYLTPRGRPVPLDMRSNDRAFQHLAIVVSDMPRAYQSLRDRCFACPEEPGDRAASGTRSARSPRRPA